MFIGGVSQGVSLLSPDIVLGVREREMKLASACLLERTIQWERPVRPQGAQVNIPRTLFLSQGLLQPAEKGKLFWWGEGRGTRAKVKSLHVS